MNPADYTELYKDSARVHDDLIKGVSPIPAIHWMEVMPGCPVEISAERNANGEYPIGQPILRGIRVLIGALRENHQALIDAIGEPGRVLPLARRRVDALLRVTERQSELIEPFYDGYVIEQDSA